MEVSRDVPRHMFSCFAPLERCTILRAVMICCELRIRAAGSRLAEDVERVHCTHYIKKLTKNVCTKVKRVRDRRERVAPDP